MAFTTSTSRGRSTGNNLATYKTSGRRVPMRGNLAVYVTNTTRGQLRGSPTVIVDPRPKFTRPRG